MPVMPSSVCTSTTRSSWLPSAIPSSSTGCRRITASTSVIFNETPPRRPGVRRPPLRPPIVDYRPNCLQSRPAMSRPPLRFSARSISTLRASISAGSSCRARPTRAAGRTCSSRSSRSAAATGRPRSSSAASTATSPEGQVAALNLARETRAEDVHGQADHRPVRLTGRLARLHAPLAVGREPQPLVPGLARTGHPTSSWPTSSAAS